MRILTTNFVQCAVKACAASGNAFPLIIEEASLESTETDFEPQFISNIMNRVDWKALLETVQALGRENMRAEKPEPQELDAQDESNYALLKELHELLIETSIVQGTLKCKNCGHVYFIKDSIPNFLLPGHLA